VRYHLGDRIGNFVEYETETIYGQHNGFWYYTIGQRQGIGLAGGPWYVVSKDVDANIVYISRTYYAPDKIRCTFEVAEPHWIAGTPDISQTIHVKLRHGKQMHTCDVNWLADNRYQVMLHDRDQGIAPGQYAVFYKNRECIGSGVIAR
jgi:tRNA-specific 2-thiouridylase